MSTIIFDFDGTLADSFGVVVRLAHELTGTDEPLTAHEIERLRGMSAFQVARELEVRPWKIPFLVARGRRLMRKEIGNIHLFPGIAEAVRQLNAEGHDLYIMSSNSVQNIRLLLNREDLDTEFIKLYGGVGLFGKARVLRRVVRQNKLNPRTTLYVGDEVRDIEGARRAGVRVAAVTWGYNNERALAAHKPDRLVRAPAELASLHTV